MNKIIVDIGASDHPDKMARGALEAAKEFSNYVVVTVGDEQFIRSAVGNDLPSNFEIVHAPDVITNDDVPTKAIRQKPESSLVKSLGMLTGSDEVVGLVSGGSTGAVLTGATLLVGRIKGVHRPTLACLMPTSDENKLLCVSDCGANVDSKPEFLAQFAVMADIYMRALFGIEKPAVGLLSVGPEEHKGDERTKAAHELLKALPINFVGNLEARYAFNGQYDIVVTDGFSGNVLVKSMEGTAKLVMSEVKAAMMSSFSSKLGALFMKKQLGKLKVRMDYHAYGGAAFLGVKKLVVKTHGSSNEVSTKASVRNIIRMYEKHVLDDIAAGMATDEQ